MYQDLKINILNWNLRFYWKIYLDNPRKNINFMKWILTTMIKYEIKLKVNW